ncbi:hypothetical protein M885DRAFT_464398 [Pelagophyceae sp. CCMP2097]|nr:hypothetical protein M885DRAFT_464398 [Pelagophyceae sp. CCMP2097]
MLRRLLGRGLVRPHLRKEARRRCGIFAVFDYDGTDRANNAVVQASCAKIAHRGPDGVGVAAGKWATGAGVFALGHTRLAIVAPDEVAANQPFELGGGLAMVSNGEIYDHGKLWTALVADGYDASKLQSRSDCEVIAHLYAHRGAAAAAEALTDAGMFAFCLVDSNRGAGSIFAARDPTGIKPLYYGVDAAGRVAAMASELKALVDVPGLSDIQEFPCGHYYTPEAGFVRYYEPAWATPEAAARFDESTALPQDEAQLTEQVRDSMDHAVGKRMMSDVEFGLFLSGGVDSCIVGQLMMKRCREELGISAPPSYTVGMADSPDIMAARAMARELGSTHHERLFTAAEAVAIVEKVVYHIETYNAELIRSAIPNYFLAELAGDTSHGGVKMVLTGEGADELWAGYAYFADAPDAQRVHSELTRIYGALGTANLLRTDRMTMAHSLEARVPFLDVGNTALVMGIHPRHKLPAPRVPGGKPFEKAFLRRAFEREHGGVTIPADLLWRPKAMQCEGVGEDWVAILQAALSDRVSDALLADAPNRFPHETPQSKEEYFYRDIFEQRFGKRCEFIPRPWVGGCRAAGAAWTSASYTRHGLADVSKLTHAFQAKSGKEPEQRPPRAEPDARIAA